MKHSPLVVGIVGGGTVGAALHEAYNLPGMGLSTRLYDMVEAKSVDTLLQVLESDVVLLCLPTPAKENGIGLDVSALEDFCKQHAYYKKVFIIKSTVPVGTTKRLAEQYGLTNLYHSPEFLSERNAVGDAQTPKAVLVGSPYDNRNVAYPLIDLMIRLMEEFGCDEVIYDHSNVTEMAKLALNTFYGLKVSYFNEVYLLCEKLGIQYGDVQDCVLASGMIYPQHTHVPGPDGMFGFGGKCLPKDTAQFIKHHLDNDLEPVLSAGALVRSTIDRQRKVQAYRVETVIDADTPLACTLDNGRTTTDKRCLPHRNSVREHVRGKSPCRCVLVPIPQEASGTLSPEESNPSSQEVGAE